MRSYLHRATPSWSSTNSLIEKNEAGKERSSRFSSAGLGPLVLLTDTSCSILARVIIVVAEFFALFPQPSCFEHATWFALFSEQIKRTTGKED